MKKNKKENVKKKDPDAAKLGFRIMAVLTGILVVCVGLLCTSPSKAADDAPYFPPVTEPDTETDTETETDPVHTEPYTDFETLLPIDIEGVTFEETEPDTETDSETDPVTETETEAVTTEAAVTAQETTAVTKPVEQQGAGDKQKYREYNGRKYADNETFVGEYKTDRVSIGVSHVKDEDLSYFICDIRIKSVKDLHKAFANPNNITSIAYSSKIASSVGAGFAVNGDYCGFRYGGIIIREGRLYRNKKSGNWDLCYLNKYGDLITCRNDKQDGKALANDGVWQSWCFGPTLVENYKAIEVKDLNTPGLSSKDWAREPRTAICQVDELHYIIVVVDAQRVPTGLGGWNTIGGMNFGELAETCASLGCKTAYNLDGGGSTTLYLNGKVINEPSGNGERAISDIIYFK